MFFTEKMLETLLLVVLLSLAGNDYTSESSDTAVVSTTARNGGVLGDLIVEAPQCSLTQQKSPVTESFYFGENFDYYNNSTSLQCLPNLKRVQPLAVVYNISENSEDGKDFNPTFKPKNEWLFRETSTTQNNRFSFLKGRIAISENVKYLLELNTFQKALFLLVFLLCFIWKYRIFLLSRLNTIIRVHSKRSVPRSVVVEKIQLTSSEKVLGLSSIASEETSLAENDDKLPERSRVNHGKTGSFKNDLTSSSVESDSQSGDSSDDEFPDEFFLVGNENGHVNFLLTEEDWEPIDLAQYDSESRGVRKNGSTNLLKMKDWELTNVVQINDTALTSSCSVQQGTSSHTFEDNTTDLLKLKDLKDDGDSRIAPLGDQDGKITEYKDSVQNDRSEDGEDIVSDQVINPGELTIHTEFLVQLDEDVNGENPSSSSVDCEKSPTNLSQMRNWKMGNLSCDLSDDDICVDDCPNTMTNDAEKVVLMGNLQVDDHIDRFETCDEDDEFPDEFFLFCDPDDKSKNLISTKDLHPDDIVSYDEDDDEFPDKFFLLANPDDKTKNFMATKDLHPEDLVSCDDAMDSPNADVISLGNQSDVASLSSESQSFDEDVSSEDITQDDPGKEVMNSINVTLLFLSVAFVLPCLFLRNT